MDFRLTDEQELLVESIRQFCQEWPDAEAYWKKTYEEHLPPLEFNAAYRQSGLGLLGCPEEFGGTPTDIQTRALEFIELGRNGVPVQAVLFPLGSDIWPWRLMPKTEEIKKKAWEAIESGNCLFAIAISEPQAGSDDSAIATTWERKNGKIYLNGTKTFVTDSNCADYIYTIAKNPNETNPKKAFTGFLVPANAPGLKKAPQEKIGMYNQGLCELYLDNVEIDEEMLVGEEGNGFIQIMKGFEAERITAAAECCGWAMAAYEDALNYANTRVQFGKNIGSFQLIQEKLVDMKIKIDNMYNKVMKTAWLFDEGIIDRSDAAMCKLYCVKSAFEVCNDALQVFGGLGYTKETRIYRLFMCTRFWWIGGGTNEVMYYISGRQLLKQAAKNK